MMRQWKLLARDTRAAAVIELALVAPILATMVIGATEISAGYSARLQLEQAAQRIVEKWQGNNFDTTKIDDYRPRPQAPPESPPPPSMLIIGSSAAALARPTSPAPARAWR